MTQPSNHFLNLDPAFMRKLFNSGNRKQFVAGVRLALQQILVRLHVESHYAQVMTQIKREPRYRDLTNTWEKLKPAVRIQKWQELMERLVQVAYATRPYCLRCGECCRLGSPSLHQEDTDLMIRGLVSTRQLYTLRKGEPVRFNLEARLGPLPRELIKIKEDPENRHCVFYLEHQSSCRIYDQRPLQCRVQACWNPGALEKLWQQEKLTRRQFLKDDQDLLQLLAAHDERCAPEKLDAVFKQLHESGDLAALDQVLDILRQDTAFRGFLREKLNREDDELEFLLGRPLAEIIRIYGVKVERTEDGTYHLLLDR
jgi:Fe-S-cluster containining protein